MALPQVMHRVEISEPPIAQFLFADTRTAWFWLLVRLYAGYEWLTAGVEKLGNPVWTGSRAGTAIAGFVAGALRKTGGTHPDVTGWYASFLQSVVLPMRRRGAGRSHSARWPWGSG